MTPQMEQIMKAMGQEVPKTKRVLELNPDHDVLNKLQSIYESDAESPLLQDYAELLYGQAVLAEGGQLENPSRFTQLLTQVMSKAI